MKKLLFIGVLSSLVISCVPDKDKRDKRKADHSAEHMRNKGVDSAALSPNKNAADTVSTKESGK
ncbi:hypothetical protein ACFOWU_14300 [Epilithonimonas zeae]|uniref:Uncharacterized protein n=1 Tax=Epilithonimonas zeae TaxID=1416779 RepID=A0A1N6IPI0_9FLAO|nr:hypothetical protein [Epilithonimonas zeae]SIO33865.1 hypothetical protein SAMN05444409_2862 [Epilithonimonas zeae]